MKRGCRVVPQPCWSAARGSYCPTEGTAQHTLWTVRNLLQQKSAFIKSLTNVIAHESSSIALNPWKTSSDINNTLNYDVSLCKLEMNSMRGFSQMNPTETVWHHPPLLQYHPKPNTTQSWYFLLLLECSLLFLVNYIFTWQIKQNNQHIKDEIVGGRFLASEALGKDPKSNNEVRQCHTRLYVIFCGYIN